MPSRVLAPYSAASTVAALRAWVGGGRVLLLICVFVLLVHDNQAQLAEGQEHGRTHSQNDVISAVRKLFLPDFHPFGIRKLGVINSQPITKYPFQTFGVFV